MLVWRGVCAVVRQAFSLLSSRRIAGQAGSSNWWNVRTCTPRVRGKANVLWQRTLAVFPSRDRLPAQLAVFPGVYAQSAQRRVDHQHSSRVWRGGDQLCSTRTGLVSFLFEVPRSINRNALSWPKIVRFPIAPVSSAPENLTADLIYREGEPCAASR